MYDENDLIYSPLQRKYSVDGHEVEIHIYRMPDTGWSLEVVDENNNSTVWEDLFASDEEALAVALQELTDEGIEAFIARGPDETTH